MLRKASYSLAIVFVLLALLVISGGLPSVSAFQQQTGVLATRQANSTGSGTTRSELLNMVKHAPKANSVTVGCNISYEGYYYVWGDYSAKSGTFFVYSTSDGSVAALGVCYSDHSAYTVALPPSGAPSYGYEEMAGIQSSSLGTVLVTSNPSYEGFFFCFGAYASVKTHEQGCAIESSFISLPNSFCTSEPAGYCTPVGVALDKKLNLYYTDPYNQQVVKCTYASGYQSCSVIESLPNSPFGLYLDSKGNIWVTDGSCAGDVWKNGNLLYSLGDSLWAITNSTANPSKQSHLYIGVNGECLYGESFVFDVNDDTIFVISSSPGNIPAISTTLQVTSGTAGTIFSVKDKS